MTKYPGMKKKPKNGRKRRKPNMAIMREAVDKADFERMEKGLKPRPKAKVDIPDPEGPMVKDRITLKDVPIEDLVNFTDEKRVVRNREGVMFMGSDVIVRLKDKPALSGWMAEKDILQLRRLVPR